MTQQFLRLYYKIAPWLALFAFALSSHARADETIGTWRFQVDQARILAENNVSAAYKEARRLQATLPDEATPSDKVRLLNLLARIEVYLAQTDAAATPAREALDLARQHHDKAGQAEADLNIVLNSINLGRLDEMSAAALHAVQVLDGVDRPELLAEALLRVSMMHRRQGQFEPSVAMIMQAMDIARRSGNPAALAYAYQGMGHSFDQSNRLPEALEYFVKMRKQARMIRSRRLEAEALVSLGHVVGRLGDETEAERIQLEALNIYNEIGIPFGAAQAAYSLAETMARQDRHAAALLYLDKEVAIYEKHPNKIGLWWALIARSQNYQSMGRLKAASADAERAHELAKDIRFPFYQSENAKQQAAIAADQGNHRRAYELSVEADRISAKAELEKASTRIIELTQGYETESRQRQIDELNRRNERQIASIRQHEMQQRQLATIAGSSLLVLSATTFFLLRMRRSNRQLEQARRHQQAILDAMPDTLFELGLDGRYYECRSSHFDLPTALEKELTGKTVSDAMPREVADIWLSALREAHEKGISTGKQFELPLSHGMAWFELSVARESVKDGADPRFIVISRDITERKQMMERLREREQEFRTLVENSPDVIVRYDRKCRRIYINPAYMRLYGSIGDHVIGKKPTDIFPEKNQAKDYQAMLNYVMANAVDSDMQLKIPLPDGRISHHHARLIPEFDSAGNVCGVLAIGRDITLAKEAEIRLQDSRAMLRELAARNESVREAERKRIAREIHDELGQMLNVMRVNVQVLAYQFGPISPLLQDKSRDMQEHLDRTISIVRDIVSALHPSVLTAGIAAALDWLTQEFSKNTGIACNLWIEKEIAFDEEQVTAIFRIVQESLTNVLRHSGADLVEISLSVLPNDEAYLLEITDNGKGFDPEQPRKQKSLGLLGIQERAIMLGGSITLASSPALGTVLQVHIPISR